MAWLENSKGTVVFGTSTVLANFAVIIKCCFVMTEIKILGCVLLFCCCYTDPKDTLGVLSIFSYIFSSCCHSAVTEGGFFMNTFTWTLTDGLGYVLIIFQ